MDPPCEHTNGIDCEVCLRRERDEWKAQYERERRKWFWLFADYIDTRYRRLMQRLAKG